jgi:hypothetical protein
VQPLKTPKPATARHGEPVSKVEWLGGPLDHSNTRNCNAPQAPDNSGESDGAFFAARPQAQTRRRLAFPAERDALVEEFPQIAEREIFVEVTMTPAAAGQPPARTRVLSFASGGNA